jgi:hypothetical protein
MLPMQHMTRSDKGDMQLATMLGEECVPTDLGPKCYIALGRPGEHRHGDSVTKCHLDMSDAINIMLHQPGDHIGSTRTIEAWSPPDYMVRHLPRCSGRAACLKGDTVHRVSNYIEDNYVLGILLLRCRQ